MPGQSAEDRKAALSVWCPRCYVNPYVPCKAVAKKSVHVLRVHYARKTAS